MNGEFSEAFRDITGGMWEERWVLLAAATISIAVVALIVLVILVTAAVFS